MQIPFTIEDFLNVFKSYNQTFFPLQVLFYFLAFFLVYHIFKPNKMSGKIIGITLAFMWLWIGIAYHLLFFTEINDAAYLFSLLFIVQGLFFFIYGFVRSEFSFSYRGNVLNYFGIAFLVYSLIIYPVLGHLLGHRYPYSPTFGLPCPTTIFTFGLLLFADKKISVWILIIPFLWSVLGFSAALNLTIYEDFGLIAAGLFGSILILLQNHKYTSDAPKLS
jgi:hypothetical protein